MTSAACAHCERPGISAFAAFGGGGHGGLRAGRIRLVRTELAARKVVSTEPPRRTCGACTACCSVMGVAPLNKPVGEACPNLASHGCGIYSQRPQVCRDFTCLWLADRNGVLRDEDRPDLIGLVLTEADRGERASLRIAAREVHAGAASAPAAAALIEYLRQFVPVVVVPARQAHPVGLTVNGRLVAA